MTSWDVVEQAKTGDREAFATIWSDNHDLILGYVYRRVTNRELAEDITSDVFLRALRRISRIEWQGRDISAWLITIAHNLVVDHFKSRRTRLETLTGEDVEVLDHLSDPAGVVVDMTESAHLHTTLTRLTTEQATCVRHRFLGELSVAETAELMGMNEGAVKAVQYRGIQTLRRLYKTREAAA